MKSERNPATTIEGQVVSQRHGLTELRKVLYRHRNVIDFSEIGPVCQGTLPLLGFYPHVVTDPVELRKALRARHRILLVPFE
jgi:hypothetical protein